MKPAIARFMRGLKEAEHWTTAQFAKLALGLLRRLPPDRAVAFADSFARKVGPWFGRHRVALDNLRHAFPEKTDDEREKIALDMWGNMGRLAAEYVFLEQLFDFDPDQDRAGRVEVSGIDTFIRLAGERRPRIIFTGHLGNFELLPVAASTFGLELTAMFRPPNNPYIAEYVLSRRKTSMGGLVASRSGAAFALARVLEKDGNIGVLVDQKFQYGIRTRFFGRECETSPLLPKLARQYDCDVHPARCVRLPGNRFRLVLGERLDLPRDVSGQVDVQATAQLITDIVEGWIREDPGQWMWFHKRWNITPPRRRNRKKVS